jgi:hypothetical protein
MNPGRAPSRPGLRARRSYAGGVTGLNIVLAALPRCGCHADCRPSRVPNTGLRLRHERCEARLTAGGDGGADAAFVPR